VYNVSAKRKSQYTNFEGHKLTQQEAKFIEEYLATGNARQSVINAGYLTKTPSQYATKLLNKDYIWKEIEHARNESKSNAIADMNEIMEYYSDVMRGKITDQFGLEAPLSERTKAASELARRHEAFEKLGKNDKSASPEIVIKLDWNRD
jgi:phage terminase small subunit